MQLRDACGRAGLGVSPGTTPMALVARIRASGVPSHRAAERVVDLYLRSRYGGEVLGDSELGEMREALRATRRTLKARPG